MELAVVLGLVAEQGVRVLCDVVVERPAPLAPVGHPVAKEGGCSVPEALQVGAVRRRRRVLTGDS